MKKHIKNIIASICFVVILFEYFLGFTKSFMVGDMKILIVTTVVCGICLFLLKHYIGEDA